MRQQTVEQSDILDALVRDYNNAKTAFESVKKSLTVAMESLDVREYGCDGYTAFRREEVRKAIKVDLLLSAGVAAEVIAVAATGCNKKALLGAGVDPDTITDCSIESSFVKCYVAKDKVPA